ncbi:MAG: hypothetical protein M1828_004426 [Chrysothrix sp. TS-e1954]|nr:MAG: hypothetical protein M1828_004426 [Chrysothrix sp. TS-e1954]
MHDEPLKTPIVLLKTRSKPSDGYEDYFSDFQGHSYSPIFVPVLVHSFVEGALGQLESLVTDGAFQSHAARGLPTVRYGGIIFTSQRAVEAFATVVDRLHVQGIVLKELLPASCQLYVVGPATARGLKATEVKCSIVGEESGNGQNLASFIQTHYDANIAPESGITRKLPLLFLVGEQRRDIIPKTLQDGGLPVDSRITVDEVTVYETQVLESFSTSFKSLISQRLLRHERQWIVVFSPTGCQAMLQALGLIDASCKYDKGKDLGRKTFIATIGPTTRDYLWEQFQFVPDACAKEPTPKGVGDAINAFVMDRDVA